MTNTASFFKHKKLQNMHFAVYSPVRLYITSVKICLGYTVSDTETEVYTDVLADLIKTNSDT